MEAFLIVGLFGVLALAAFCYGKLRSKPTKKIEPSQAGGGGGPKEQA